MKVGFLPLLPPPFSTLMQVWNFGILMLCCTLCRVSPSLTPLHKSFLTGFFHCCLLFIIQPWRKVWVWQWDWDCLLIWAIRIVPVVTHTAKLCTPNNPFLNYGYSLSNAETCLCRDCCFLPTCEPILVVYLQGAAEKFDMPWQLTFIALAT